MAESERLIQTYMVAALMRMMKAGAPILFAGDMAAQRRSKPQQLWAKNTGLVAGEPDLRIYGPGGALLMIEVKRRKDGSRSKAQIARHKAFQDLGHEVRTLKASTGDEAARLVTTMVENWLNELGTGRSA